jgi:5-methylcytosine-specific restriction endonuclease McrA
MPKDKDWKHRRMRVLAQRDGWQCFYCHAVLMPIDDRDQYAYYHRDDRDQKVSVAGYRLPDTITWPTLDHKVPTAAGGTDETENLVLACGRCNTLKGYTHTHEDFYTRMEPRRRERDGRYHTTQLYPDPQ